MRFGEGEYRVITPISISVLRRFRSSDGCAVRNTVADAGPLIDPLPGHVVFGVPVADQVGVVPHLVDFLKLRILKEIGYDAIVGKWQTEAEREVFKETTAYSEAAASFLADSYKQYNNAETDADKNTIMEYCPASRRFP